jgi:hypothetical protein
MYDDIAEETGYDRDILRHYKRVAENVESGLRNPLLGWSHHQEVASLTPEKQELSKDLSRKVKTDCIIST